MRQHLRHRSAKRGSWIVEIRDPNSEHAFAARVMPDEASALALLDPVRDQLTELASIDEDKAGHLLLS